jgi:hypothetical protein
MVKCLKVLVGGLFAWAVLIWIWQAGSSRESKKSADARVPTSTRSVDGKKASPGKRELTGKTSNTPVDVLWGAPLKTHGEKLASKFATAGIAVSRPEKPTGRVSSFDAGHFARLENLTVGSTVLLPISKDENFTGVVTAVLRDEDDSVRIAGSLDGELGGTFSLAQHSARTWSGLVLLPSRQLAYVLDTRADGTVQMVEKNIEEVICFTMPRPPDEPLREAAEAMVEPAAAPPILSSRPSAAAVIYLDFDGETVTDPDWTRYNGGNTIVAAPSPLSASEITDVWNRLKEKFATFDVDITTDLSRYQNAAVGRRMRCIITPTAFFGNVGGVGYVGSFANAGRSFTSTIPCWVFNSSSWTIADAAAHELGHTLGLNHDGRTSPVEDYYAGHGSGSTSWGPIMGASYFKSYVQWSKGEYPNANNHEDDLAIIASAANGFGYVADEAGNSRSTAADLNYPGGSVSQTGFITSSVDADYYRFTGTGNCTITATAASPLANLDIAMEVQDANGLIVVSSNPDTSPSAAVSATLSAGTYYVKISGAGRAGNPNVGDYGYSTYGSIGAYTLTGTIGQPPVFTAQPIGRTIIVGTTVTLSAQANGTAVLFYQWRRNGVNLSNGGAISGATTSTLTISNAALGNTGDYSVVVTNSYGTATSNVATVTVQLLIDYSSAATADFDGDGFPDMLWRSPNGLTSLVLMNGNAVKSYVSFGSIDSSWIIGGTNDFNGDGKTDILWRNTGTGSTIVMIMNGTSIDSVLDLGTIAASWRAVGTGDFNRDGHTDILWRNSDTGGTLITLMNGASYLGVADLGYIDLGWQIVDIADFNRDGKPDILWRNSDTGGTLITLMNGTSFGSVVDLGQIGLAWQIIAAKDFNSDGQPDVLWRNSQTGGTLIVLMNGTSVGSVVSLGEISLAWRIVGIGDFNRDGKVDVAWRNTESGQTIIVAMNQTSVGSVIALGLVNPQ